MVKTVKPTVGNGKSSGGGAGIRRGRGSFSWAKPSLEGRGTKKMVEIVLWGA